MQSVFVAGFVLEREQPRHKSFDRAGLTVNGRGGKHARLFHQQYPRMIQS